jgi:quercetin dioxygenase-like cupin family protein
VIKGKLIYELGDKVFDLEEGDSLLFNGNIPHLPKNHNFTDAQLLVIYFIEIR